MRQKNYLKEILGYLSWIETNVITAEKNMLSFFDNKRLMVIVPHQDDEINVAGTVLAQIKNMDVKTKVVYLTDGGYFVSPLRRRKEAIKALKMYGIHEKDIAFLGYSDFCNECCARSDTDIAKIKLDISNQIVGFRPDYIFTNAKDKHPNHIELANYIDDVLDNICKNSDYSCMVFKTYAYDLAFYAENDYSSYNLAATKNVGRNADGFEWNERLRLPVPYCCRTMNISTNQIYKSLWRHHSQTAFVTAMRIANSDKVYWCKTYGREQLNIDEDEMWFAKITINNNYVYKYYTDEKKVKLELEVYGFNGKKLDIDSSKVKFRVLNNNCEIIDGIYLNKAVGFSSKTIVTAEYDGRNVDSISVRWNHPSKWIISLCKIQDFLASKIYIMVDWFINELYIIGNKCWSKNA